MFIGYCTRIRLSKHTTDTYISMFRTFNDFLTEAGWDVEKDSILDVDKITLKDYFSEQQYKCSIATVKTRHAILSSFYRWLVEERELMEVNLVSQVVLKFKHESKKQPTAKRSDVEELMTVFQYTPIGRRDYKYFRNKLIIQLLYGCGLRCGELVKLAHCNFDEEEKSFRVTAKGDKEHIIFIGDKDTLDTYYTLRELQADKESPWVFPGKHPGSHLHPQTVNKIIQTLLSDAGLKTHLTPHAFRRGCATALIENDVDISIVKDVLGHSNITTTMRYVNISDKKVRDTMRMYNPMNKIAR